MAYLLTNEMQRGSLEYNGEVLYAAHLLYPNAETLNEIIEVMKSCTGESAPAAILLDRNQTDKAVRANVSVSEFNGILERAKELGIPVNWLDDGEAVEPMETE